jgi:hypothetical protein
LVEKPLLLVQRDEQFFLFIPVLAPHRFYIISSKSSILEVLGTGVPT